MRILIDIGHPAHVHLFKNFATEMIDKGHKIHFICRDKEFEIHLLKTYGFTYTSFGKKFKSTVGKIVGMLKFDVQAYITGLKFKPDLLMSHGSMYAAHAAFLLGKPHISFEDTYNFEQIRLYKPFTKFILTSDYDNPLTGPKIIRYAGYHELAYLHPNRFIPNNSVLQEIGVSDGEKFTVMRFVSWNASHDVGHKGLSLETKLKAVEEFSKHSKIFISSEGKLPPELEKFRIKISPEKIHHVIAFSALMFGESSTMAEEAAMLGVPSIYLFNNSTIYTTHLEDEYGLIVNYSESEEDQMKAINKGVEILRSKDSKNQWRQKREKMITSKIDVTAFMIWFIETYPESAATMNKNKDYQNVFK